jgi:hypothetical protein
MPSTRHHLLRERSMKERDVSRFLEVYTTYQKVRGRQTDNPCADSWPTNTAPDR